jgi:hypothetical protein
MTVLGTIMARVVVIVRGIASAEIVVQVIIWHSFYLANPWRLTGPAAAIAWGATTMVYLRRHRPSWQLVCLDTAVYAGLAFGGAARERNVPVEVQLIGDPGDPGEDVVRATVAAVGQVLRALPPQPVILTVLGAGSGSGDEAEMYLTFERPPVALCDVAGLGGAVPAGAAWRAALEAEDDGPGCLEIRWQEKGEGEAGGMPA